MAQRPGGSMAPIGPMNRSGGKVEEGIVANVKAVLRVRPCLAEEDFASAIRIDGNSAEIGNPRNPSESLVFKFDGSYGAEAGQAEIFRENLAPLIDRVLAGYNGTVFAYGNTGAGKTFTMQGSASDPGMIPLAVADLLAKLSQRQSRSQTRWTLGMSYLEIYKEKVYDLLSVNPGSADLPIREDQLKNILIPGLTVQPVRSLGEFEGLFEAGLRNRSTAATKLNSQSSRSHACLILAVEQRPPIGLPVRAKLSLIDLAGSEDNRRTDNTGVRLAESGSINSSLFVLGQVVDALNKKSGRVPYRDSKLTRLLQDSLGGRAHALLITNVAPTEAFISETHNSLNFAAKSRQIQNRVVENAKIEEEKENLRRVQELNEWKQQKRLEKKSGKKTNEADGKKKKRKWDSEDEEEDSIYEVSEMDPPSSMMKRPLPTPPITKSNDRIGQRSLPNPFQDPKPSAVQSALLERQIEEKVAAKLREISKGTILSPLLKSRTTNGGDLDLKALKKAITAKKPSPLSGEKREKTAKEELEAKQAAEHITGLFNMFPTVEPDLLHILNHGNLKQLKGLKECGKSRAELILSVRPPTGFASVLELLEKDIFSPKVLSKLVYANSMEADTLAALAHSVIKHDP